MAKINGIEGLTTQDLLFDIKRGGKFVVYRYCISLIVISIFNNFRGGKDVTAEVLASINRPTIPYG